MCSISSFSLLCSICVNVPILYIHPNINGHLNYFQSELAILNNAAKNILVISLQDIPRIGLLGHRVHLWLALVNTASLHSYQQCMAFSCPVVNTYQSLAF